ncbi:radical SAM family heme chaperone HemW [Salidesulfovibrio brasiliensis]|uniref:radical SAM family heme chaperone HemW n=1 Tax=Salidesulfovibrio brasiliensis TaxID=221711 RepID=UPI0006D1305C|nr:radical SAM family heme chaperone HemW [Salidesulfovibrio brasiliensis]
MAKIHQPGTAVSPAFPFTSGNSGPKTPALADTGLLLYVHVPFCRSRCHYCTFHSQAFNDAKFAWYHKTLLKEIELWSKRLGKPKLRTVYFGGGTPSLYPLHQLDQVMKALHKHFGFQDGMEVTLEANPDSACDVSWFRGLMSMGFNRLSLGVQSLRDEDLLLLGRPHSSAHAVQAYHAARDAGFLNISLDFIWGLPKQRLKAWIDQLKEVAELKPEHISAYSLTMEPKTQLNKLLERGEIELPSDTEQGRMFIYGAEYLESMGYMHYEVSNFARMGFASKHNSGYWDGTDYLGLGPSAVSTIGRRRFTNPRYLDEYDAAVRGSFAGDDFEELSDNDLLSEMVMLSLRTAKGLDLKAFRERAGFDLVKRREKLVAALHRENLVRLVRGRLKLTKNGMLVSNAIIRSLVFSD